MENNTKSLYSPLQVCDIAVTGELNYEQHVKGHKHTMVRERSLIIREEGYKTVGGGGKSSFTPI